MTTEMTYIGSGGGGAEKPTLLWSDNSGTNSTISIDHSAYQYLIFICGSSDSAWNGKKVTLCDKTRDSHLLAMGTLSNLTGWTYMGVYITTGQVSFTRKESNKDLCYAIYGCNSLSIDYTDIWASGDIA